ncbi:hypothetical protein [Nocardiopsis sp. MG754419]|uniref:hypothetical protein n=1 Tax=Nocardiopsis sp. MG754419 TaxID=2259865 RepID=UPI0020119836|nr:hypothetical protein [Nocardiopsis sp. MG754419]
MFAAIDVDAHTAETSMEHLTRHHPPPLSRAAGEIGADVARVASVPQVDHES